MSAAAALAAVQAYCANTPPVVLPRPALAVVPPLAPVRGRHRPGCRHCAMVREYRVAREAAELAREAATGGYATEGREYGRLLTFKDWLVQTAASREQVAS